MPSKRFVSPLVKSVALLSLGFMVNSPTAWAQTIDMSKNVGASTVVFNAPVPPSQGTPDGRQRGGASRGPCSGYETLTALVPAVDGKVWGLTTHERPTIWFYLPEQVATDTPLEFVMQDANDDYVYHQSFTIQPDSSRLISISLPADATALDTTQTYTWTLSAYCDPQRPNTSVAVQGTIQRVELADDLTQSLAIASPLEQAQHYAASGIWYDSLNTLAELYQSTPSDAQLTAAWTNLLQQANLNGISQ